MTKTFWIPIIVLMLALSALVAIYLYQHKSVDQQTDGQLANEVPVQAQTEDRLSNEIPIRTWRSSKNWILFSAPWAWEVNQLNFGGGSVIEIENDDGEEASIITALNRTFVDDELIPFSEWTDFMMERKELRGACQSQEIDSISAICRMDDQGGKHYFVETPTQYFIINNLELFNGSIVFFPDDADMAQAEIIP